MSIVIAYNIFLTNPSTPVTATPPLKLSQNPNLGGQLRTDLSIKKPSLSARPPLASAYKTLRPEIPRGLLSFLLHDTASLYTLVRSIHR
jgi:hypothetical protein